MAQPAQAQKIRTKDVKRIVSTLAADDMGGRPTFKPGIDKASAYLENEFKKRACSRWPAPMASGRSLICTL
ncbi:hypothetical protein MKQ70_31140 [Chitinophaga sedimenti]|uniref:hypothetical protein n=1 Tax=Chitinophaga sedimenti TaxID=2033606 RepID=UPI0020053531|nr:hypothetical protein [Chitinophaga sedimenti]MCK7559188.1 hypothetical protein [Chitinophaga sedimenti]